MLPVTLVARRMKATRLRETNVDGEREGMDSLKMTGRILH